jgi:hypothetical protein
VRWPNVDKGWAHLIGYEVAIVMKGLNRPVSSFREPTARCEVGTQNGLLPTPELPVMNRAGTRRYRDVEWTRSS